MAHNLPTTTLERIEDAALSCFARYGYHASSMRTIASEAEVQPATMYHWFANKEALVAALMRRFLEGLTREVVAAIADKSSPVERLAAAVWAHVVYHGTHRKAAFVTDTEVRALTGEQLEEVMRLRDGYQHIFLQLVRDGQEAGVFQARDARIATFAILLECTGVAVWFRPTGELTLPQVADIHVELVLNSLNAGRSAAPARRNAGRPTPTQAA